ncbi:MAG TPA: hypothetical protein VLJ37_03560 [bacterium]|nr:hypothetical protein [bacterium]
MAVITPSLSAWTLSAQPALVQDLGFSFLAGLRGGLPHTPYLSEETRQGIDNLLRREAPVRQIGDALMISLASEWAKHQTAVFGSERVSCVWHGAERLFQPLTADAPAPSFSDFESKKARYLEDFGHLDLMARAILEVRFPTEALAGTPFDLLQEDFAYLDDAVRPLGFFPCTRLDRGEGQEESVFRFFSLSALELGLYVFLGTSAPRFCLGPGSSSPRKFNDVHKAGYHLVGAPVDRRKVHGVWTPPLSYIWHGICHGAFWATHESPVERLAATLLYESAMRTMNGERKLDAVALQMGHLLELELSTNGGVWGILNGLKEALEPRRFHALARDYDRRLEAIPEGLPDDGYAATLRNKITTLASAARY